MAHLKFGRSEKSSFAQHTFENDHRPSLSITVKFLDIHESLALFKKRNNVKNSNHKTIPS